MTLNRFAGGSTGVATDGDHSPAVEAEPAMAKEVRTR